MSSTNLRIAVIGCGKMGMHHVQAIAQQEHSTLVAVVDPVIRREKLNDLVPASTRLYQTPEEMFAAEHPDVVHIVTPPGTHTDLATLSLENKAHVYVEKPFALDSESATRVLELARENQLKLCAAHQVLFQPTGQKYLSLLHYIKRLVHIESYFSFKTVRGSITPVDQLIDILPHPIYLMLSAFDRVEGNTPAEKVKLLSTQVDPLGEVRAIFGKAGTTAILVVSLNGRPVESYLRVVGTNGSINADFVLSGVSKHFGPGASAIAAVLQPFSLAVSKTFGTIASIFKIIFKKHKGYSGLVELIEAFYSSIRSGAGSPVSDENILATVSICAKLGDRLTAADAKLQQKLRREFDKREAALAPCDADRKTVVVTGGTGFLGKVVVRKLRQSGWPVRVICRRIPGYGQRIPGVKYFSADLGDTIAKECLDQAGAVVHLAAETAGGKEEHERNSIRATENLVRAAHQAGVSQFINIGSIAVMKPGGGKGPGLNESSAVDWDNLGRGPYVWGKAQAEQLAGRLGAELGLQVNTIRLGPLVDYANYQPPGRLGREVGTRFIAMGSKRSQLSVCDLETAADIIGYYLDSPGEAPTLLNLVEPKAPTRLQLLKRHLENRPELSVLWMPNFLLIAISTTLKGVLKLLKPGNKPIDVYAAFSAEKYDTTLAGQVIGRARNRTQSE